MMGSSYSLNFSIGVLTFNMFMEERPRRGGLLKPGEDGEGDARIGVDGAVDEFQSEGA